MKLCPKCGKIANYSSYFGAYICSHCRWKDDTPNKERLAIYHSVNGSKVLVESGNDRKKLATI